LAGQSIEADGKGKKQRKLKKKTAERAGNALRSTNPECGYVTKLCGEDEKFYLMKGRGPCSGSAKDHELPVQK